MQSTSTSNQNLNGILFAAAASLIWSGNFIIARAVNGEVPPITLAFLRWVCASIIMIPFALNHVKKDWKIILTRPWHFIWVGLLGISLFNTLIYVAGHHTSAINLALIGTTSVPVFTFILARIFLKERIPPLRMTGLIVCITGILLLLSRGSFQTLINFQFTTGDWWILGAALSFSIYNILVRRKPTEIHPSTYLAITFWVGTLLLLPFFVIEYAMLPPFEWTPELAGIIFYLGAGASVLAFYLWNIAIAKLGAARTSIFGNLIPIFSSIEAVVMLGEKMTMVHTIGLAIVITGLVIANIKKQSQNITAATA